MAIKKTLEDNKMAKKSQTSETVQTQQAAPTSTPPSVAAKKSSTKSVSKKEETPAPVVQQSSPVTVKKVVKAPSKKTEQPTQLAAPVATQQAAPAPVATKEKKSKALSKKSEPVAVVEPVVAQQTTATESTTSSEEAVGVQALFDSCISQVEGLIELQKNMVSSLRRGWKLFQKESKEAAKNHQREKRRARKDPNRKKREPTGFAVASSISDSLCSFLGVTAGTKLSRTDVTRKVTAYIRENNLQIPTNKRCFVPDAKLSAVLGPLKPVDQGKGYNYFNLQRYITPHFPSTKKAVSAQ
jgi:chromatin remodeling complex protein RSC6